MTTVTLKQAASHDASNIHTMTARPMNVALNGLAGGPIQFTCTNNQATIQNATTVDVTYDANVPQQHDKIAVSSVI